MSRRSRGLTMIELMIVLSILGVVAVCVLLLIVKLAQSGVTDGLFDREAQAKAWAKSMNYTVLGLNCTNSPGDNNYVRCSLRAEGQPELIPLECGVISKKCSVMRLPLR